MLSIWPLYSQYFRIFYLRSKGWSFGKVHDPTASFTQVKADLIIAVSGRSHEETGDGCNCVQQLVLPYRRASPSAVICMPKLHFLMSPRRPSSAVWVCVSQCMSIGKNMLLHSTCSLLEPSKFTLCEWPT